MGMVYDDPTTDPRGVALSHEGVLAAVLLDGANTSSYSGTPGEPGSALRYAGAEPVLSWVAECECGWRGPECLAVLHPRPDRCPGSRHPSSTRPGGRPGTPTSRPCSPPRTDRGPRPRAERDRDVAAVDLLIARNPDPDSTLPYLLRVPLGGGLVFRTKGTWPRTSALYCHPVPVGDWPEEPELVERVPLRACARRGAAIDVVADRGREARSQIVFTRARGREVVFWQSPEERAAGAPALGDVHRERGLARSRRDRVQPHPRCRRLGVRVSRPGHHRHGPRPSDQRAGAAGPLRPTPHPAPAARLALGGRLAGAVHRGPRPPPNSRQPDHPTPTVATSTTRRSRSRPAATARPKPAEDHRSRADHPCEKPRWIQAELGLKAGGRSRSAECCRSG